MKPTIGRIVLYKLNEWDAKAINDRRTKIAVNANAVYYTGSEQIYPMLIVRVWPNEFGEGIDGVNGQVFLDGHDTHWVTSVREGDKEGQWIWPPRV